MTEWMRQYRQAIALFLCTCLCGLLLVVRVAATDQIVYWWLLIPNLALAWIPYLIAAWLGQRVERLGRWTIGTGAAAVVWLFFLPNCFYIITDMVHLGHFSRDVSKPQLYKDIALNGLALMLGWWLGVVSLLRLHAVVRSRINGWAGHGFALAALALSSIGVYLGRFLRWNSWDLVKDPLRIVRDSAQAIGQADSLSFIVIFAAVTLSLYYLVYTHSERSR